jgi:hypothetical protein
MSVADDLNEAEPITNDATATASLESGDMLGGVMAMPYTPIMHAWAEGTTGTLSYGDAIQVGWIERLRAPSYGNPNWSLSRRTLSGQ